VADVCGALWQDYAEILNVFREFVDRLCLLPQQPNERVVRMSRESDYQVSILQAYNDRVTLEQPGDVPRGVDPLEYYRFAQFRALLRRTVRMLDMLRHYVFVCMGNPNVFVLNVGHLTVVVDQLRTCDIQTTLRFVSFPGYPISVLLEMEPAFDCVLPKVVTMNFQSLVLENSKFPRFNSVGWFPCPSYMMDYYPADALNLFTGIAFSRQRCAVDMPGYDKKVLWCLLNFIRFVFCDDDAQFKRLIELMACIVVAPYIRTQTLVAIIGKQGDGKSTLANFMRRILGPASFASSNREDSLTGQFADLMKTLLVCDDTAKERFGTDFNTFIKAVITGETVSQNKKFLNAVTSPNNVNVWFLDNSMNKVPDLVPGCRRVYLLVSSVEPVMAALGADQLGFFKILYRMLESDAVAYLMARYFYLIYQPDMSERVRQPVLTIHARSEIAQRQFREDMVVQFAVHALEAGGFESSLQPVDTWSTGHNGLPMRSTAYKMITVWPSSMESATLYKLFCERFKNARVTESLFVARLVGFLGPHARVDALVVHFDTLESTKSYLADFFLAGDIETAITGRVETLKRRMANPREFFTTDLTGDLWGVNEDFSSEAGEMIDDYEIFNREDVRPLKLNRADTEDFFECLTQQN